MATWDERYTRLATILKVSVSSKHDAVDLALDSFTDAQRQPGRSSSSRAAEVEKLRFGNKDLTAVGTLTKGQFGNVSPSSYLLTGIEYSHILTAELLCLDSHCSMPVRRGGICPKDDFQEHRDSISSCASRSVVGPISQTR